MISNTPLSPDQLEVEARFYFPHEDGSPDLELVQLRLVEVMNERGFSVLYSGQRVWEFVLQRIDPPPSLLWKVKKRFGRADVVRKQAERSIRKLRGTRGDHPYRVKFRFVRREWDSGEKGYIVEVVCIPAIREKIDQLEGNYEETNPKSAVRSCKTELRDIATEMGFTILSTPATPAEYHQATLNTELRKRLQEIEYGNQVIHFADDADEALRYSLIRPALSAYFHGIEWAIIVYILETEDRDIIKDEEYGRGKGFLNLVEDLKATGQVPQTTIDELESMNTERIWMAHHKSGNVSEISVQRVKQRFSILLEELFR